MTLAAPVSVLTARHAIFVKVSNNGAYWLNFKGFLLAWAHPLLGRLRKRQIVSTLGLSTVLIGLPIWDSMIILVHLLLRLELIKYH